MGARGPAPVLSQCFGQTKAFILILVRANLQTPHSEACPLRLLLAPYITFFLLTSGSPKMSCECLSLHSLIKIPLVRQRAGFMLNRRSEINGELYSVHLSLCLYLTTQLDQNQFNKTLLTFTTAGLTDQRIFMNYFNFRFDIRK